MSSIIKDFLAAGVPLIWVYTTEEERFLNEESSSLLFNRTIKKLYVHDATGHLYDFEGNMTSGSSNNCINNLENPVLAIEHFRVPSDKDFNSTEVDGVNTWNIEDHGFPNNSALVLMDVAAAMTDSSKVKHTNAWVARELKKSIKALYSSNKSIIILNHHQDVPIELEGVISYVEHKLPDVHRIRKIVKSSQSCISGIGLPEISLSEGEISRISQSLTGLTQTQIENILALSNRQNGVEFNKGITNTRTFKTDVIKQEKSRLFSKSGVLKIVECDWGLEAVGGMENLKQWSKDRLLIFNEEARQDGIDLPKGLCVVGPGGTGKSWVAQALGKEWDRSVLRLDIGACMGSLLGESESRLIKALNDAEAQAPCILYVDEFEKLFAGAGGGGNLDGGTFQRMYGTWLTWTQSRKSDVFVVATTNNITSIPAPALRKGRFDEVMYVGLPGKKQREEIFSIHLKKRGWDPSEFEIDVAQLALKTPNRTGSEIEQIVVEGLIRKAKDVGFGKDKPIKTEHFIKAIDDVKTMAELNPDDSKSLLEWAKSHKVFMANKDENDIKSNNVVSGGVSFADRTRQEISRRITIDENDI